MDVGLLYVMIMTLQVLIDHTQWIMWLTSGNHLYHRRCGLTNLSCIRSGVLCCWIILESLWIENTDVTSFSLCIRINNCNPWEPTNTYNQYSNAFDCRDLKYHTDDNFDILECDNTTNCFTLWIYATLYKCVDIVRIYLYICSDIWERMAQTSIITIIFIGIISYKSIQNLWMKLHQNM